jgi:hypothetical protein
MRAVTAVRFARVAVVAAVAGLAACGNNPTEPRTRVQSQEIAPARASKASPVQGDTAAAPPVNVGESESLANPTVPWY